LNMEFYAKLYDDKGKETPEKQVAMLTSILNEREPHFVMVQEGMLSAPGHEPLPFLEDAGLELLVTSSWEGDTSSPVRDMVYGDKGIEELYQRSAGQTELDGGKLWKGKTLYGQEKMNFFENHLVNQIYKYPPAWDSETHWTLTDEHGAIEKGVIVTTGGTKLKEFTKAFDGLRHRDSPWTAPYLDLLNNKETKEIEFPLAKRSAAWIKIKHESSGRDMLLYSTHISGGRFEDPHFHVMVDERAGQMEKIMSHFTDYFKDEPATSNPLIMVVGDFNADEDFNIETVAAGDLVTDNPGVVNAPKQAVSAKELQLTEMKANAKWVQALLNRYDDYMRAPFTAVRNKLVSLYNDGFVRANTNGCTTRFGTNVDWMFVGDRKTVAYASVTPLGVTLHGLARDIVAYKAGFIPGDAAEKPKGARAPEVDITDHNTITVRITVGS